MVTEKPHALMVFLDGVGIGRKNPKINPFFTAKINTFKEMLGGKVPHLRDAHFTGRNVSLKPINATLRVPGLPQSGTGQTSLLTGVNAARFIGKHFGPYPYSTLKSVLAEKNIFKALSNRGKKVFYANAFPPRYFEFINERKARTPAIAYSWISSGFTLNTHEALAEGKGLSADITGAGWNSRGFPAVPEITLQEGGKRLAEFTNEYDFVLFEYYLTDHAGHSQSMESANDALEKIDAFLEGIVRSFDFKNNLFFLTSDHGNIEDLSTKSHTRNPVPLIAMGNKHSEFTGMVSNLTHVTPSVLNLLL